MSPLLPLAPGLSPAWTLHGTVQNFPSNMSHGGTAELSISQPTPISPAWRGAQL